MIPYPNIDPVAFSLGPVQVRWYGLMYLFGFLLAWLLGIRRAKKPGSGWAPAEVSDLIFFLVIGLIVGARMGYLVFYDWPSVARNPLLAFQLWRGGMSFHGGMIGVTAAAALFASRRGKGFLEATDFLVPLAPLGIGLGRIGNFINGELWGRPWEGPWAMVFPDPAAGPIPRHPSQLYHALLEGAALFLILWVFSSRPRRRGAVSGLFCLGYGIFRFAVEFFREPDPHLGFVAGGWMTMGQLLTVPVILLGAVLLAASAARKES